MRISKSIYNPRYKILSKEDTQINFTDFETDSTGVSLLLDGVMVAHLYFDDATEFYKAWRAM